MRADALLLSVVLLVTGCASVTPPHDQGMNLGYAPRTASGPAAQETPHRRRGTREGGTGTAQGRELGATAEGRQHAALAHQAVLDAVHNGKDSTDSLSRAPSRLADRKSGIGGANGVFRRYIAYGSNQLRWMDGELSGARTLTDATVGLADTDMKLGILRMAGPRLQAAMSGVLLLAAWVDFLHLADAVLQQCPAYAAERLLTDMNRMQLLMDPSMAAFASREPERIEAAATALPAVMGQLTREFTSIREGARVAMERSGQLMAAAQFVEMLTLVSTLKLSLPRPPPSAPAVLGVGLVMGSGGVMAGSRLVVSAEWVEMMRRLVRAGVLSLPAVSAAVRIHAGQVLMAQAQGDLP